MSMEFPDHFTLRNPFKSPQLKDVKTLKLVLNNSIKAYLISDPQSPFSGAALAVDAGSWHDPSDKEGMAHFLEHCLFLGTQKYPEDNDFERFIYDNSGSFNAYTASDHSLYHFTVTPSAFHGALDRFSRFFYEPLLNSNADRERNAVDQEFRKNIESDYWRALHVRKELADPSHPFSMFNTGNLESMSKISTDELEKWFNSTYSANLMSLVVLGTQPIEELRSLVEQQFITIPNRNHPKLNTSGRPLYPSLKGGTLVWIDPIKDLKKLTVSWEVPNTILIDPETHPGDLLGRVLGYEGKGSLLSQLKKFHWVDNLSAGSSDSGSDNGQFEVSVTLTDDPGMAHWQDVLEHIFKAIADLRENSIPKYIFDESNYMSKVHWDFQQRSRGIVTSYAALLRKEPIQSFPERSFFTSRFDPKRIHEVLDYLTPSNAIVQVLAHPSKAITPPSVVLDRQEKHMGAVYGLSAIPPQLFAALRSSRPIPEIHSPHPNEFIPQHLTLVEPPQFATPTSPPELLTETNLGRLWFAPDVEFRVPEVTFDFVLRTPALNPSNPRSQLLAILYSRFIAEDLREISYDAAIAGLHFDTGIAAGSTGIRFAVDGYSEKALQLLTRLLKTATSPNLSPTFFRTQKAALDRALSNRTKDPPLSQSFEVLYTLLAPTSYLPSSTLLPVLRELTFADLQNFIPSLFDTYILEGFVGGNASRKDALDAWESVVRTIGAPKRVCAPAEVAKGKAVDLEGGVKPHVVDVDVPVKGNAMVLAIHAGHRSDLDRSANLEVLSKLIKEPYYSELRTKQQTAYIVHSGLTTLHESLFLILQIQSDSHDPSALLHRTDLLLEQFLSTDFRSRMPQVLESTLSRLRKPHDSLPQKLGHLRAIAFDDIWGGSNAPAFDLIQRRIAAMENVSVGTVEHVAAEVFGRMGRVVVCARGVGESRKGEYISVGLEEAREWAKNRARL
ncbi:Metalloenzyme, LuxS/M16 peptidase-like protein [Cladochytrium replicatum]|nr:Metalloenzyme, LuxS/M16 peptidase-like protein [Cladochytrium replicatum]